jgi:hypothetical protein
MAAAAAALVLVVGGAFALGLVPIGRSTPETSAAPPVAEATTTPEDEVITNSVAGPGQLQVESVPDGARVVLDGREVGFTPVTVKDVPAGRHSLVLEGESGTVRRTVRVQAGERTVARYEITAGFLSVVSRIPLEIYDGNRKLGTSDGGHVTLPPGTYSLRFVNAHYGYQEQAEFTIRPGEVSTHTINLPDGSLIVNAEPGAEIMVDGEPKGTAPRGAFPVPIGTRDVVVRHAQYGERRQSVDVVAGRPTELTVILDGTASPKAQPRLAPLSMPPERRTILPQ